MVPLSPLPPLNIAFAVQQAANGLGDAEVRDDLHLKPNTITRAAEARAIWVLRALEAYVRRMLILIALQFEHVIEVDISHRPYPKTKRKKRARTPGIGSLRIFGSDLAYPDIPPNYKDVRDRINAQSGPLPAAPILARIKRLRDILNTAEARGHRLAYTLARHRHGILLAPLPLTLPNRLGPEVSGLYRAMGHSLLELSRYRPPPQKPRPPPPPRARFL